MRKEIKIYFEVEHRKRTRETEMKYLYTCELTATCERLHGSENFEIWPSQKESQRFILHEDY